jgi:uncharacterized protein (TIGR03437 family)
MRSIFHLVSAVAVFAGSLLAANPTFTGVVNPASNIPPGLPNYGIAQGSIFVVYGANLGPSALIQASSLPLPTNSGLSGTSITVTVNGTTVTAPMIYTFQSQVAAVLPSLTPVGTGNLTLTYNGASASTAITVVTTNFGISTVNQSGGGPAVVTYPNYSLVTKASSAKPGDTLVIWGTGLGAISGSDAVLPVQTDLGTPIQVFVGGVQANVLYRGRSAGVGLDQINVVVPSGVAPGCSVSLVVQTGALVSNNTSISIAPAGGQCSDAANSQTVFSSLSGKSSYRFAEFILLPVLSSTYAEAAFEGITQADLAVIQSGSPSIGSCTVTVNAGGGVGTGGTINPVVLNAGTAITLTPPSGAPVTLAKGSTGAYAAALSSVPLGTYQATNGAGGPDVGPFTVTFAVPTTFVWANQNAVNSAIDRTQPLTITWLGGDPSGIAQIQLTGVITVPTPTVVTALCVAPVSVGQFTIPPNVLLNLPSGNGGGTNKIAVSGYASLQTLTIPGLDLAFAVSSSSTSAPTTFK